MSAGFVTAAERSPSGRTRGEVRVGRSGRVPEGRGVLLAGGLCPTVSKASVFCASFGFEFFVFEWKILILMRLNYLFLSSFWVFYLLLRKAFSYMFFW